MVSITAIGAAMTSLNAAMGIAKVMVGLRDAQALQTQAIEFQSKILDAQNSIFAANEERTALIEEIRQLKEKMAELETWNAEKQKYELKQVDPGAFTYVLKPDASTSEPPHWLCTSCYQRNKKSLLQAHGRDASNRTEIYKCSDCGSTIRVHYTVGPHKQRQTPPPQPAAPINPALACPKCGLEMKVVDESPHPMFGEMGVKVHRVECTCGNKATRDFQPGKGYT